MKFDIEGGSRNTLISSSITANMSTEYNNISSDLIWEVTRTSMALVPVE